MVLVDDCSMVKECTISMLLSGSNQKKTWDSTNVSESEQIRLIPDIVVWLFSLNALDILK